MQRQHALGIAGLLGLGIVQSAHAGAMSCSFDSPQATTLGSHSGQTIDVDAFDIQTPPPADTSASGSGAGKPTPGVFHMTSTQSATAEQLIAMGVTGTTFSAVTCNIFTADDALKGTPSVYLTFVLTEVYISNISVSGSPRDKTVPSETVEFSYGSIKWTYTQQKG